MDQLTESYKLADKTVFSSINMINQSRPNQDVTYQRELAKKEKKIKDLEDKFKQIKNKKATTPSDKPNNAKKPPVQKDPTKPTAPAVNQSDKPLSVEERDNLIKQISQLNEQQSQGIIEIVSQFAQKDDNNQVTFELTQLPIDKCRNLQ